MKQIIALIVAVLVIGGIMYFSMSDVSKRVSVDLSDVTSITIQRSRSADVADELELNMTESEMVINYLEEVKFYSEDVGDKGEPTVTMYPRYRIKMTLSDGGIRTLFLQPDYYIIGGGNNYRNVWAEPHLELQEYMDAKFE